MRTGILRLHVSTLRLRPDAPFPSQLQGRVGRYLTQGKAKATNGRWLRLFSVGGALV